MDNTIYVIVVAVPALFAGLGCWVAGQKNRSGVEGAILGLVFGPIGVIVEALLPAGDRHPSAPTRSPVRGKRPDDFDPGITPDLSAFGVDAAQRKPTGEAEDIMERIRRSATGPQ